MKTSFRFVLIALVVLAVVTVVRVLAAPTSAPRPVGPTAVVLAPADPLAVELQAEIEHSQQGYAELFRALASARTEPEAFAAQDAMRQNRTGLQVALLRIQAAYARRAGRERLAVQLERAIAELVAPEDAARTTPSRRGEL